MQAKTTEDPLKIKLRPDTPTFTPISNLGTSNAGATIVSNHVTAPVFVPRGSTASRTITLCHMKLMDVAARPITQETAYTPNPSNASTAFPSPVRSHAQISQTMNSPEQYRNVQHSTYGSPMVNPYEAGNDMFFQQTAFQPLQYHLYASLPPNKKNLAPNERSIHDFFLNDKLREDLQKKQQAALQTLPDSNLPQQLHSYHSLVPLNMHRERANRIFGYPSWVYKAFCKSDGQTYALRRIEGFKLTNEASIGLVEKWRKVVCANIVTVREAFTSKSFADNSIVFVHEYHPLSVTLYDLHFGRTTRKFSANAIIGEKLIWSYLTQLVNALRAAHAMGLACRVIDLSKVLVTEKNRLRINACGVLDVLAYNVEDSLSKLQRQDVALVGVLILNIALNTPNVWPDADNPFDLTQRGYSEELDKLLHNILDSSDEGSPMELPSLIVALSTHSIANFDAALMWVVQFCKALLIVQVQ